MEEAEEEYQISMFLKDGKSFIFIREKTSENVENIQETVSDSNELPKESIITNSIPQNQEKNENYMTPKESTIDSEKIIDPAFGKDLNKEFNVLNNKEEKILEKKSQENAPNSVNSQNEITKETENKKEKEENKEKEDNKANKKIENNKKTDKESGVENSVPNDYQIFIFSVVFNEEYLKEGNPKFIYKSKKKLCKFQSEIIKKLHFPKSNNSKKEIKKIGYIYEVQVQLPSEKEKEIKMKIEINNKKIKLKFLLKDKITIKIEPIEDKDNIDYILKLEQQNEKEILFNKYLEYFKEKDSNYKRKFLESYIKESKDIKIKDILDIANLFENKLLDKDFEKEFNYYIISKIKNFYFSEEMIQEIFDICETIKNCKDEEISPKIISFVVIILMKINNKQKFNEFLSLIANFKNKEKIGGFLFNEIKIIINKNPDIKNYFIDLLQFKPDNFNFIVDNIDDFETYINIISSNFCYLTNNFIDIFPDKLCKNNPQITEDILHQIINITNIDKGNIDLDSKKFKKYCKNYINILNTKEQEILKNYYLKKGQRNEIVREIGLNMLKTNKNNKEIVKTLIELEIWKYISNKNIYIIIEECLNNLDLQIITNDDILNLKKIINGINNKSEKNCLYNLFFKKLK